MKNEWNLSSRIFPMPTGAEIQINVLAIQDVRECFRRLLENPCDCKCCIMWRERINKRAGEKLIVPQGETEKDVCENCGRSRMKHHSYIYCNVHTDKKFKPKEYATNTATKIARAYEEKPKAEDNYEISTVLGLTIPQIEWMKHYFKEHSIEIKEKKLR